MFAKEQKKGPLQAGGAGDFLRKASPQRGITQVIPVISLNQ